MSTVKINKSDKYFTFINVFTLHDPANQQKFIDVMSSSMSGPGKTVPGFISAALHRSLDGTKVTVYSQWSTREAGDNLRSMEVMKPYGKQFMELASMTPVIYEVVDTFVGIDYKP